MYILTKAEADERDIEHWRTGDEIYDIKYYLRRPEIRAEPTVELEYAMAGQTAVTEAHDKALAQGLPDHIERNGVYLRSLWDYLVSCIPNPRDGGEYNLSSILRGWREMVEAVR